MKKENDIINRDYRNSDILRWQMLDFVVGYEIHRSNNQNLKECEICQRFAGKYPKSFIWHGWHDGCICYVTPIMMDDETDREQTVSDLKSALHGTEYKKLQAKNLVKHVPEGFIDWFLENRKEMNKVGSFPYFVTDNMQLIMESYNHYKLSS